jgi:hypothetical protein
MTDTTTKKKKRETLVTPEGKAQYAWLTKADDKFGDPVYKVNLILEGKEADSLKDSIDRQVDESLKTSQKDLKEKAKAKGKKAATLTPEYPYDEMEDGSIAFKFKLKKQGFNKATNETWENSVALFDSAHNAITEDIIVGGGSTIQVAYQVIPYSMSSSKTAGISLRLQAAMILSLQSGGNEATAEGFGFNTAEGGYVSDTTFKKPKEEEVEDDCEEESKEEEDF